MLDMNVQSVTGDEGMDLVLHALETQLHSLVVRDLRGQQRGHGRRAGKTGKGGRSRCGKWSCGGRRARLGDGRQKEEEETCWVTEMQSGAR